MPANPARNARWILLLLFVANVLNFYDRTVPSVVIDPLKAEFGLTDTGIGLISISFTVVYAIVGIPLGWAADTARRRIILAVGLVGWSVMTAATGLVQSLSLLILVRMLTGMGEASFAPAANSLIGDLYPADRRARATGLLQLGLPVGLVLAFFTVGSITEAYGTWRAAFLFAAVPGVVVAVLLGVIREPRRGAVEPMPTRGDDIDRPIRRVLRVPTMRWLILAGTGAQVSFYAVATFSVPLFERWFGTTLKTGGVLTGITIGFTGLVGLVVSGRVADHASRRSPARRIRTGAFGLLVAAPLTGYALTLGPGRVGLFVTVFSAGWLLPYAYFTASYPAVADVIEPRLRATAIAIYFAAFYLLGGAVGPLLAGALSDHYAHVAAAAGLTDAAASAYELHRGLFVIVPTGLLLAAAGMFGAARRATGDGERMRREAAAAAEATPLYAIR